MRSMPQQRKRKDVSKQLAKYSKWPQTIQGMFHTYPYDVGVVVVAKVVG